MLLYFCAVPFAVSVFAAIAVGFIMSGHTASKTSDSNFTIGRMPKVMLIALPLAVAMEGVIILVLHFVAGLGEQESLIIGIGIAVIAVMQVPMVIAFARNGLVFDKDTLIYNNGLFTKKEYPLNSIRIVNVPSAIESYKIIFADGREFLVMSTQQGFSRFKGMLENGTFNLMQ